MFVCHFTSPKLKVTMFFILNMPLNNIIMGSNHEIYIFYMLILRLKRKDLLHFCLRLLEFSVQYNEHYFI